MKKKVMIIGAGAGQVPLINLCKQEGLYTYVVSPFGPYPGIELADTHINEDIYHVDALVEIGRELGVDYVISDQSDYAVPLVASIADRLGLPGNKPEVAQTYSYKSKFRTFCEQHRIPAPKARQIQKGDDLPGGLTYPLVVKPSDSQGSRGISKVDSADRLEQAVQEAFAYSKKGTVVIEEFSRGVKWSVRVLRSMASITLWLSVTEIISTWPGNSFPPRPYSPLPFHRKSKNGLLPTSA